MTNQKEILMLCYFYPPTQTSGTLRSLQFSKHLKSFGYKPVVLTVEKCQEPWYKPLATIPEDIEIHRTKEFNIREPLQWLDRLIILAFKLFGKRPELNYAEEVFAIPDLQVSWAKVSKGKEVGKNCDCIYVSCSPFSSALAGIKLKKTLGKPLIIDFRDAWSNYVDKRTWYRQFLISRFEKCIVKNADIFIANTPRAGDYYRKTYPKYKDKIRVITNGFDNTNVPTKITKSPFKILHVGTFYGGRQPDLLFRALSELDLGEVEFVQVGEKLELPEDLKGKVTLNHIASVPHAEALELMKTASLLYLKQAWSTGKAENFAVAQKTYEYLATGLPILVEAPESDNTDIVNRCCANPYLVTENSLEKMKEALSNAYQERNNVAPMLTDEAIDNFSRKALAEKLKEIIEEVC